MLGARRQRRKNQAKQDSEKDLSSTQPDTSVETTTKAQSGLSGPLKALARGRSYLEYDPETDDEGYTLRRELFGRKDHDLTLQNTEASKDRVVGTRMFVDHINATVFSRIFGHELRHEVARMLLEGLSNEMLDLISDGYKLKLPNAITMKAVHRDPRLARNPRTGESVQVPARTVMVVKPHPTAKAYLYDK